MKKLNDSFETTFTGNMARSFQYVESYSPMRSAYGPEKFFKELEWRKAFLIRVPEMVAVLKRGSSASSEIKRFAKDLDELFTEHYGNKHWKDGMSFLFVKVEDLGD